MKGDSIITKKIRLIANVMAVVVLAVVITACTKESTDTPGTTREAFLGKWNVTESYTKLSYEVTISADPGSSSGVFIYNFAGTGSSSIPAGAEIAGSSIILDANQVIGTGLKINGSGNLSGSKINWNYTLDDGANLLNAIAIYTKQ
jgi:hypothetical protein